MEIYFMSMIVIMFFMFIISGFLMFYILLYCDCEYGNIEKLCIFLLSIIFLLMYGIPGYSIFVVGMFIGLNWNLIKKFN